MMDTLVFVTVFVSLFFLDFFGGNVMLLGRRGWKYRPRVFCVCVLCVCVCVRVGAGGLRVTSFLGVQNDAGNRKLMHEWEKRGHAPSSTFSA